MDKLTKARICINFLYCMGFVVIGLITCWFAGGLDLIPHSKDSVNIIYKNILGEIKLAKAKWVYFDPMLTIHERRFVDNEILSEKITFETVDGFTVSFDCNVKYSIDTALALSNYNELNDLNGGLHMPGFFNNKILIEKKLGNEVFVDTLNYSVKSITEKIMTLLKENIFDEDPFIKDVVIGISNLEIKKK